MTALPENERNAQAKAAIRAEVSAVHDWAARKLAEAISQGVGVAAATSLWLSIHEAVEALETGEDSNAAGRLYDAAVQAERFEGDGVPAILFTHAGNLSSPDFDDHPERFLTAFERVLQYARRLGDTNLLILAHYNLALALHRRTLPSQAPPSAREQARREVFCHLESLVKLSRQMPSHYLELLQAAMTIREEDLILDPYIEYLLSDSFVQFSLEHARTLEDYLFNWSARREASWSVPPSFDPVAWKINVPAAVGCYPNYKTLIEDRRVFSQLIHEFSHLQSCRGDFAFFCIVVRTLAFLFDTQVRSIITPPGLRNRTMALPTAAPTWGDSDGDPLFRLAIVNHMVNMNSRYHAMIELWRPVLEGIAIFAQIHLDLGDEKAYVSDFTQLMHQFRAGADKLPASIDVNAAREWLLRGWNEIEKAQRLAAQEEGRSLQEFLLRFGHKNTLDSTYLVGYLLVRRIYAAVCERMGCMIPTARFHSLMYSLMANGFAASVPPLNLPLDEFRQKGKERFFAVLDWAISSLQWTLEELGVTPEGESIPRALQRLVWEDGAIIRRSVRGGEEIMRRWVSEWREALQSSLHALGDDLPRAFVDELLEPEILASLITLDEWYNLCNKATQEMFVVELFRLKGRFRVSESPGGFSLTARVRNPSSSMVISAASIHAHTADTVSAYAEVYFPLGISDLAALKKKVAAMDSPYASVRVFADSRGVREEEQAAFTVFLTVAFDELVFTFPFRTERSRLPEMARPVAEYRSTSPGQAQHARMNFQLRPEWFAQMNAYFESIPDSLRRPDLGQEIDLRRIRARLQRQSKNCLPGNPYEEEVRNAVLKYTLRGVDVGARALGGSFLGLHLSAEEQDAFLQALRFPGQRSAMEAGRTASIDAKSLSLYGTPLFSDLDGKRPIF